MKRIFLLLLLAGIFTSCNELPGSSDMPGPEDPASKYAVSVDAALANLQSALEALESGDTRAGSSARRVESIRPLKMESVLSATRSSLPDADNLLYVVAFEQGRGSAVLGADTRVAPVYAVLDQTVFTPGDFVRPATRSATQEDEEQALRDYLTGLILDDALYRIENAGTSGSGIDLPGGDGGFIRAPTYDKVYKDHKAQSPLLRTKWHQGKPYNDQCDWNSKQTDRCPAGCSPIAVAQVLTHNQSGSTITLAGTVFVWNLINECTYGSYPTYAAQSEVARFVHTIGVWMNTTYGDRASGAPLANAPKMFRHAGYQGVDLVKYDKNKARNMVYTNKAPFYMFGANSVDSHAWVIDGWDEYTLQDWMTTYGPNNRINPPVLISEVYHCYVHCNFGWGGMCDGYYWFDTFNTNQRLNSSKIDGSVGDYAGTTDYPYNNSLQMIVYTK